MTRTAENVDTVGDLVRSQENQPQTHCSTRQISRELEYLKQITGDNFF